MRSWIEPADEYDGRPRNRGLRSLVRDERGQALPGLLVLIIALLAAGMLVLWLGLSTSIATNAQTAADAAALAAEKSVDTQWNTLVNHNGVLEPQDSYDPTTVLQAAQRWASSPNKGTDVSVQYCSQSGPCSSQPLFTSEPDVLVTLRSSQTLPRGSVSPGAGATAQARASVDPFGQASPADAKLQTRSTCDSSGVPAPVVFKPHGGQYGFFPADHTDFEPGCESRLAAHLDAVGKAKNLHLVGVWGAGATDPGARASGTAGGQAELSALHACGAAVEVKGLPSSVSATELAEWGLTRISGQPDEVEFLLLSARCATITTVPAQSTNSQQVSLGNGKVHLVPVTGGPQGSTAIGIGSLPGPAPGPAIASYMPIFQQLAKQYGWDQGQLQDWLAVEQIEDAQGILGVVQSGAFGLGQFQVVNYCRYGPGSCPQANPTAAQELQSMAQYIHDRYGDPAAALAHELSHHWY